MFSTIAGNIAAQRQADLFGGDVEGFALLAQDAKGKSVERSFSVDGQVYSLGAMQSANSDDLDLCDWLMSCKVGDVFPAFVECIRVA